MCNTSMTINAHLEKKKTHVHLNLETILVNQNDDCYFKREDFLIIKNLKLLLKMSTDKKL